MCVTNTLLNRKPVTLSRSCLNETKPARISPFERASHALPPMGSFSSVLYPNRTNSAEPKKVRPKRMRKPQKPGKTAKNQERHFVVHNYHDRSMEPCSSLEDQEFVMSYSLQDKRIHFPLKLHKVLDQVALEGLDHIISWMPHGRCFVIHKPKEFTQHVMPMYFRQSKLTSFQRQLNLYGFQRITRGQDAGGYYNEYFLRGLPALCKQMTRVKVKGTKFKAASNPAQEPDFYTMPFVSEEYDPRQGSVPIRPLNQVSLPVDQPQIVEFDPSLFSSVGRLQEGRPNVPSPVESSAYDMYQPLPLTGCRNQGLQSYDSFQFQPIPVVEDDANNSAMEEISIGDLSSEVVDFCADWAATEKEDSFEERLQTDETLASLIERLIQD